jgi:hypothetical protein
MDPLSQRRSQHRKRSSLPIDHRHWKEPSPGPTAQREESNKGRSHSDPPNGIKYSRERIALIDGGATHNFIYASLVSR